LSELRVIPFYESSNEWTSWSEKFLVNAKITDFKDILLEISIIRKKKFVVVDLNDLAFTELILLIDDSFSSVNVTFDLVKGYKSKNYADGNAYMAWERLK
jgi:hypothetical protein